MTVTEILKRNKFNESEIKYFERYLNLFNVCLLYRNYSSAFEFKREFLSQLNTYRFKISLNTSIRGIYEALLKDSLIEEAEAERAKDEGPLSELEEYLMKSDDYIYDPENIDLDIDGNNQFDGFDIADAADGI